MAIDYLKNGATDYLKKPIPLAELIFRIKHRIQSPASFSLANQTEISGLTPIEEKLFKYLSEHPDRIITKSELRDFIWPQGHNHPNIDGHLTNLRRKLGPKSQSLLTIRGKGIIYRP